MILYLAVFSDNNLREKCSKVKCYRDLNLTKSCYSPPGLNPGCVRPGKYSAVRAELRPDGQNFLHHHSPLLFYLFTIKRTELGFKCRSSWASRGLGGSLDGNVNGSRSAEWPLAECAGKTSPLHVVIAVCWSFNP